MLLLKTQMLLIILRGWPRLKRDFMSRVDLCRVLWIFLSSFRSWKDTVLDSNLPIEKRKLISNWEYPVKSLYSKVHIQTKVKY